MFKKLKYPAELQCLASVLSRDFVSVEEKAHEYVAIPVEHICLDISTFGVSGITTLVNQNEVVK